MRKRTNDPEKRELAVTWNTQSWVPRIAFAPAQGTDRRCTKVSFAPESFVVFGKKPARSRVPLFGRRDGSRPTWR